MLGAPRDGDGAAVLHAGVRERRGAVATTSARFEPNHRKEVTDATTQRQQLDLRICLGLHLGSCLRLRLRLRLRLHLGHCALDHQLVAAEATPLERP